MTQTIKLTIFYDSTCVLCMREMQQLQQLDVKKSLDFIALNDTKQMQLHPNIDPKEASKILHAQQSNGQLLLGLDATCYAWQLVNKHKWLQILRWPIIRHIADLAYRFFARNRYWISYLLTGQKPCTTCYITQEPVEKSTKTTDITQSSKNQQG